MTTAQPTMTEMTLSLTIRADVMISGDPETIVRLAIKALSRFEAHVPASVDRVLLDDRGNEIGRVVIGQPSGISG